METTAGSVTIQISATTAAFEAALAKAQQQATAFDAQITAKLSGAGMSAGLAKIAGLIETNNALLAKMVGAASPAAAGLEKVAAATKSATATLESFNLAQLETKANFSVMGASMQQYEAALVEINGANKIGVELEKQKTTLAGGTIGALNNQAGAARTVATETEHVASASRLGSTQMMSLAHAGRSAAESLALGVSPMQALMMQANHLSYALGGEQGLIAATAGARAAFAGWLTSIPGILTTAGVAAVGGLTAYVLTTRNSIQSVDQVLSEHKALIDEIAAAYPEAAKAAKQYEEAAKRIPQSVASADIKDKIKENQKTLDDTLGFLTRQLQSVSQEFGLVGEKGAQAFGELAAIGKSGAADSADRIAAALGRMRVDPALSENARQFAKDFQDAALKAGELQDKLNEKNAVKDIVDNNKRASLTMYELAGSFDKVQSSAGGANDVISKMFGTLNSGSSGEFGIERSVQSTLSGFQMVDQAVQEARRNQLTTFMDLGNQLRSTTQEADQLKQAIASAASSDNVKLFFGDVSGIANANGELQRSVDTVNRLFDALNSGNTSVSAVYQGLDMIRQTLIRDGFGTDKVNAFIDRLIEFRMRLDQDTAGAKQLNTALQAIRDRVINVTVVTRRVGTGTQSIYDVPGGTVGVTRYGGDPNAPSGPSMQAYNVPVESGYGSQGGVGSGTGTVTVTRFGGTRAGGGPIDALTPYLVGENGPEIVLPKGAGTVIPNAQSVMFAQALASAQSGFTGMQPTQDADRMWTVQMNIEGNTKRTAMLLDEIRTATAASSSAFGGSSSSAGGSSSGVPSDQAAWDAAYSKAFASAQANYQAARMGGGGDGIVPFAQGLVATPAEIARNAANLATGRGGTTPVLGFDSGGMIPPGDTQHVEFFKNPNERVIIARPDQYEDRRASGSSSSDRPVKINLTVNTVHNWKTTEPPQKHSMAEIERATSLAVQQAIRGINGRWGG
ncbi:MULTISPECIES: hypothetical protein [unclassified Mesorhizobium]|uniref:hypothetical protein n=1 Tax=unclassified Mesorhizobium TaxID=325217 RepID=UPI000FCBD5C6|nr:MULTISPECIES: hypothetical protein [unclassified Mesorhizobium]RVD54542.1 hypothetical protein EN783_30395 [Mesorhizobium sp. M2D.F.Ca.ET.140.01.1.1]TGP69395.1 hypothetical protein EN867_30975 [Mesorhizobium sp. M2D.F.Ca.ET.224.01.1.1]TGP86615.1 hypothetical protein EN865_30970 [bacterium M00.F.Ca.ET.222.01.1.1]